MNRLLLIGILGLLTACTGVEDALTGHARPVAEAAGLSLPASEAARIVAQSPLPDSALTAEWVAQVGRLWADYVVLATLYLGPDTTAALDFGELLEDQRYFAAVSVLRYRDSVVLAGLDPTDEELRRYYDTRQPYTRLNLRRIMVAVPDGADEETRDRVFRELSTVRESLVGGADFVEAARTHSTEERAARGQMLMYQGHGDVPAAADSVLFALAPGELSPVVVTDSAMYVFLVEERRTPDFESAREQVAVLMKEELEADRRRATLDSLVGNARRTVREGAVSLARDLAEAPAMEAAGAPAGTRLVTWEGGALTAEDLARLFRARTDVRDRFEEATDEEIEYFLLQLARDEILVEAAAAAGMAPTEEERRALASSLAYQLSRIARQLGLSHNLVVNPGFSIEAESYRFVETVLERSQAQPWLGDYRVVVESEFPVRIHERGAELAAREALRLRARGVDAADGGEGEGRREEAVSRPEVEEH